MRSEGAFGVSQRQTKNYYRRMNLQFIIILCDKDKEQDLCIQFDLFDFTTLHSRAACINIVFSITIFIFFLSFLLLLRWECFPGWWKSKI